ncbi:Global transcription regulator sge1 [Exophiala xenobiotica]|nr:Global transcription regulator sge1 [Exophiala xenobiotica]KAK5230424.1 Global transcription regulator sge1 [Exophiala xenobiotica]KAK5242104.1 Global transcription regulator sge1 [Exophiala xenobiotica]KAK5286374.1 Global transcription regulator sge1 [Exophiala xenobiotica]KAK5346224.1 Global transcription regulator sge1 [Exophiala xenobiotica]
MSSGGAALQPTFQGHVATTQDALILFEACLQGHLSHVPRRPHDRERSNLIRSGSVFIYEENASGIKRWTDGVTWSPSRILGNFLVYRELDKPFPPGEKKRAMKKQQRRPSRPGEPYPRSDAGSFSDGQSGPSTEIERQLIGSLVDSYGFKESGLVKKTMSVTVAGVTHHLVSYYHVHDVLGNQLTTPTQTNTLQYVRPRAELTSKQSFRSPIETVDELDPGQAAAYGYRPNSAPYRPDYNHQPYYIPPNYPQMPQQTGGPAYGMGVAPIPGSYMQSPVQASHMQSQRADYNQQYDQAAYNRSYDPTTRPMPATPTSMPSTMPPSMPSMMSDRSQGQPAMYPPMSVQRPMSNMSPVSMDSRNPVSYRSSPYAVATNTNQIDQSRQSQPSPISDRREQGQQPSQLYQSPRAPYYPAGTAHTLPPAQYSQPPHMPQWPGQSHPPQ